MTPADAQDCRSIPVDLTRDCVDPWTYIQFKANGDVSPCCARPSVGNLGQSSLAAILNGPSIRQVRSGLLSGKLDEHCRQCVLRDPIDPPRLQAKVVELLNGMHLPAAFSADEYLQANPDVAAAGMDAATHYLEFGRFEARRLKPESQLRC